MNRRETASPRPTWITQLSEHVQNDLEGRGIDEVEIIIPDIAGTSRGKAMPSDKFKPEEYFFLPVSLFFQTISGAYVDMDIVDQWLEKDVTLIPDMSTATVLPWSDDPSIQIICDMKTRDGHNLQFAPGHVLRRVLKLFEEAVELWDVLGTEFCQLFLGLKRAENEEYQREISPWERRHLLLNV